MASNNSGKVPNWAEGSTYGLDEGLALPGRKFGASGINHLKEPVKLHEAEIDDETGY